jgi:uncharacterized membrane protein YoaK (UPF0700 family)
MLCKPARKCTTNAMAPAHFVATMTGNLVFLGLAAAGAKGFAVATSALALDGFVIGALIGGKVCEGAQSHRGLALRNVLAVKLWLAGAVTAIGIATGPHFRSARATPCWCCSRCRWDVSSLRSGS